MEFLVHGVRRVDGAGKGVAVDPSHIREQDFVPASVRSCRVAAGLGLERVEAEDEAAPEADSSGGGACQGSEGGGPRDRPAMCSEQDGEEGGVWVVQQSHSTAG